MKSGTTRKSVDITVIANLLVLAVCCYMNPAYGGDLPAVIERIKPSVVGVGTYQQTRQPRAHLLGTGFVVGDGKYIVTNDHVLPKELDSANKEFLAVFLQGRQTEIRPTQAVASDPSRDLVLLRIEGTALPVLKLGNSDSVREGQSIAFTGFPIGAALGLIAATHRGMISAIAPVIIPTPNGRELDAALIRRMRDPYSVFQLDATAYPGNSGSPMFNPETGEVLGILNMVYVKEGRESALDKPSGISYAIPINFVRELLRQEGIH